MIGKSGKFRELLAIQIACGVSVKVAAVKVGCSLSRAYNISCDPDFRKEVTAIRTEAITRSVGKLSRASSRAVDVLHDLLSAKNTPGVRLNAAKAILAAVAPMTQFGEFRSRLDVLEQTKLRIAK